MRKTTLKTTGFVALCILLGALGVEGQSPFLEKLSPADEEQIKSKLDASVQISARDINEIHRQLLHHWVYPKALGGKLHLEYQGITRTTGEISKVNVANKLVHQRSVIEGSIGEPVSWSLVLSSTKEEVLNIWVSTKKTSMTAGALRVAKDRKLFITFARIIHNQPADKPIEELNGASPEELVERLASNEL